MSKWLDAARAAAPELFPDNESPVPRANSANSANSFLAESEETAVFRLTAQTALTATGTRGEKTSADNPSPIVCLFCHQPVERGIPGTGALAGQDLHMNCYKRFVKKGKGESP